MDIVGYSDRLSVAPGDVIRFMVSSKKPTYEAAIVRLIYGDENPQGPGFKAG
jgi:N,N-dimethylformamidase